MKPDLLSDKINRKLDYFRQFLERKDYCFNIGRLNFLFDYEQKYTAIAVKKHWQKFIQNNKEKGSIDFYIHVPFCLSRCSYCMFPSWPLKNRKILDDYINFLIESAEFFSDIFKEIRFRSLYVGGGTPNILSHSQLKRLLNNIFRCFKFQEEQERTFEFNPLENDLSKIDLLRKFGFSRISFGVQSLNQNALTSNRRDYQTFNSIKNAVSRAKKNKFPIINIDLMAGFKEDTPLSFARSFEKIAKLNPSLIVVYGLSPPSLEYVKKNIGLANYNDFFKKYYPKKITESLKQARLLAKKYNYDIDNFSLSDFQWEFRKSWLTKNKRNSYGGEFSAGGPSSTFGLGFFSRAHIYNSLGYQQRSQPGGFDKKKKMYLGRKFFLKDEIIRFIINSIERGGKISCAAFKSMFNKELTDIFPFAILALSKLKKAEFKNDCFVFNFSKPEDKYLSTLFFIEEINPELVAKNFIQPAD